MIVYCYSNTCPLGLQAISEFARHGYSVIEMEGGFKAWKENNGGTTCQWSSKVYGQITPSE
jgi:rhodanese-related sulfurtransferase